MRILVTGGSGHVGAFLVPRLLEAGHEVALLLRQPSRAWRLTGVLDRCTIIQADLENLSICEKEVGAWKPETCVHLAWFGVGPDFRFDPRQITVNVQGSIDLLRILHGCGCRRVVGLGSQAEYGIVDGILAENLPPAPVTAYGSAKNALQVLTKAYCELVGMEWMWVRLISCFGPKDDEAHMVPYLIRKIIAKERPALTLGEQKWDYLYIEDVASAVQAIAESRVSGEVVNLGTGTTRSIRWVVEFLRDFIDPSVELGFGDLPYRHDQVMHLEGDIRKLETLFGWRPSWTWEDGLRETARWYMEKSEENR